MVWLLILLKRCDSENFKRKRNWVNASLRVNALGGARVCDKSELKLKDSITIISENCSHVLCRWRYTYQVVDKA